MNFWILVLATTDWNARDTMELQEEVREPVSFLMVLWSFIWETHKIAAKKCFQFSVTLYKVNFVFKHESITKV